MKPIGKKTVLRWVAATLLATIGPAALAQVDPAAGYAALGDAGIVLFRHANAPGVGDPPGFKLGDCSTQRNLDESGREQARAIGAAFRARGVMVGSVITSQWCRTRETAEIAFPGRARDDPDFNSFFGDASKQSAQTARALATLSKWRGPGVLVVVTHQVNITALTGTSTSSAEGVVVRVVDASRVVEVARLPPR